jgi:hypothetical protein
MPVPDFSPGEVLTAAAMDSIGLWLVKTQTIGTGVSSVTVSNAFSSTYDNYLVTVAGGAASGNSYFGFRCGTTATGYRFSFNYTDFTNTPVAVGTVTATSIDYLGFNATSGLRASTMVSSPFLSTPTSVVHDGGNVSNFAGHTVGLEPNSTSFTSFTLVLNTGTMTGGTIRVYGYRN